MCKIPIVFDCFGISFDPPNPLTSQYGWTLSLSPCTFFLLDSQPHLLLPSPQTHTHTHTHALMQRDVQTLQRSGEKINKSRRIAPKRANGGNVAVPWKRNPTSKDFPFHSPLLNEDYVLCALSSSLGTQVAFNTRLISFQRCEIASVCVFRGRFIALVPVPGCWGNLPSVLCVGWWSVLDNRENWGECESEMDYFLVWELP